MRVLLLTKKDCLQCEVIKTYLKYGLADAYKDDIKIIHKENEPELYNEMIDEHNVKTVPALIYGDELLGQTQPVQVKFFLEKHLGQR